MNSPQTAEDGLMQSRLFWMFLVSITTTPIACAQNSRVDAPAPRGSAMAHEQVLTLLSDTLRIDTTYHSMEGPYHQVRFTIGSAAQADTVWVTAMSAEVVRSDLEPMPLEFFCHANLDYDAEMHRGIFKNAPVTSNRLFTLSQGNEVMRFPEGFGIPVRTDEPLYLTTQVLSNNGVESAKDVRVRIKLHYVRKDAAPMRALFMTSAIGAVAMEDHSGHYGMHSDHKMGTATAGAAKSANEYRDSLGQTFTGHWVVPPGKQRVRNVVTKWMNLQSDAQVHYIGVHVHPFAQQVSLRDLTTGKEVFTSRITPLEGRIGISKVTDLSSVQGVRLHADHHYELITDYDNPTPEPVDAMAVLFLYVRDGQLSALESR
jgi:hypothetical protein